MELGVDTVRIGRAKYDGDSTQETKEKGRRKKM